MNWVYRQAHVVHQLSPEVRRFVIETLRMLEAENVFDAPGMIGGVLQRMQRSDCEAIRRAVPHTELVLKTAFAPIEPLRVGA